MFTDGRDWAEDQQIILDLCMSKHGRLGTRSETLDEGPPIFFSHNGVMWATSYDFFRIGMEALCSLLEVIFRVMTGEELKTIAFGKPQLGTFSEQLGFCSNGARTPMESTLHPIQYIS
ncbi:hypothetical protein GJ744_003503 [Endocarpon pusillum]|uniref:Uncharacterized protein n=1 Tax=Endocarpon pusillum TaxID=364733 RepID=A0A8H7APD4_9EURO|nr:hypothetical protein GJ744_003503 [Endocarpon pusillum]